MTGASDRTNGVCVCQQEDSDPARYLKWADAFVIVYSITNRASFETAREYVENITRFLKQHSRDCPVALVGNKIDLERYRYVYYPVTWSDTGTCTTL